MKHLFYTYLFVALVAGCNAPKETTTSQTESSDFIYKGKLYATAFVQRSAEYHALCLQAYNMARLRLDDVLNQLTAKPKAIIVDIDETVLDNSADEVHRDLMNKEFNKESWNKWTAMAAADTIPGAFSFLKYASSKGIEIFYISNRDENDRGGTLKNLQKFGFPNADNDHLFLRQTSSEKETRRQQVLKDHDVVMLIGDNLADFSSLYENKKPMNERLEVTKRFAAEFGSRFILLPNPVYGDWEYAMYQFQILTAAQKDSAIKSLLKGY